jgi:nucleoside-diphosphate-sugar epimerase
MTSPAHPSAGHLLCFGLGYTARALAERLAARGYCVTGTSRDQAGAARPKSIGWSGIVFDGQSAPSDVRDAISDATHVLVSIPPDDAGDPVLRQFRTALAESKHIDWLGYLSTIGVYGDQRGAWVDELTPPAPANDRSRRRLAAEREWLAWGQASAHRVEIFRLPGVYGPGRSAIDALRNGTARRIDNAGQMFNRMHVDDIARVLDCALQAPHRHDLYILADDEPAPAHAVVAHAAELLGVAAPPLVPLAAADLSPMAASFYGESKRVSNRRLKNSLGITLAYPTYREGLAAIAKLQAPPLTP